MQFNVTSTSVCHVDVTKLVKIMYVACDQTSWCSDRNTCHACVGVYVSWRFTEYVNAASTHVS